MNTIVLILLAVAFICFLLSAFSVGGSWLPRLIPLGLACWVFSVLLPALVRVLPILLIFFLWVNPAP